MRRKRSYQLISLLLLISILVPMAAFADKFMEFGKVPLYDVKTGKTEEYITAHITLADDDIVTDVPAIIYVEWREGVQYSRTLVPIRAITEMLGADVSWDGPNQTAHILYEGKDIALTIDSATAKVDGETVELPDGIPAKLMSYNGIERTMVPLRFLSEQMGLHIYWDSISRVVRLNRPLQRVEKIAYQKKDGEQEFIIEATDKISYVDYFVDGTDLNRTSKLFLQIANVVIAEDMIKTDKDGNYFQEINDAGIKVFKAEQKIENDVPKLYVEIEMDKARGYQIKKRDNKLIIGFVNNIKSIYTEKRLNDKYIVVDASDKPVYKITKWAEKNKYIIDILGAKLDQSLTGIQQIPINGNVVKTVSYAQLNSEKIYGEDKTITRVVLELNDFADAEKINIETDEKRLLINLLEQDKLEEIEYYAIDKQTNMLRIFCEKPEDYKLKYNKNNQILSLSIDQENAKLHPLTYNPYDDKISKIIVNEEKGKYTVLLHLKTGVSYKRDENFSKGIGIRIYTKDRIVKKEKGIKLIVIDPGHGGKDPGAISPIDGTKEKDVNLKVSLRLRELLESHGFKVYMTREYDEFIGLYTRTDIANELEADAFISIHANSVNNSPNVLGIETLYGQSPNFGKVIQENIIKMTGSVDRGPKSRMDLAVIRTSNMSAVLIEMGFLTNEIDLRNLQNDQFIDNLNQGILNGLLQYFDLE